MYTSYNYITRPFVHPYCPTAIIFQPVLGAEYPWDPKEVDAEQHSLDAMHGGYRIHDGGALVATPFDDFFPCEVSVFVGNKCGLIERDLPSLRMDKGIYRNHVQDS